MVGHIQRAFSVKGRLSRLGYWRWQLALLAVSVVGFVGASVLTMYGARAVAAAALALIALAYVASVFVVVRRLHDRGRSAWWLIPFVILPLSLHGGSAWVQSTLPSEADPRLPMAIGAVLLALILNLWGFIEIGVLRGQKTANRFGPPPVD
ncbi:MAG: DUF805 domain-containing protein [Pseudomonadota bacterium]